MTEKTFDHGTYLEITDVLYHIMAGLIQNFRNPEFDLKYETHAANITTGNKGVKNNEKSKYWFLDCSIKMEYLTIEYQQNTKLLNKLQIQILD